MDILDLGRVDLTKVVLVPVEVAVLVVLAGQVELVGSPAKLQIRCQHSHPISRLHHFQKSESMSGCYC